MNWRNSNTSGEHVEKKGRHIDTAPRDTLEKVDGERDEEHNVQGCATLGRRPGDSQCGTVIHGLGERSGHEVLGGKIRHEAL